MQLVEKGLIGLDDDVREILPQLKDVQVLLGFEGDEAATDATSNAGFDNIAKGNVNAESAKPTGKPIFEPVKGKITLRSVPSWFLSDSLTRHGNVDISPRIERESDTSCLTLRDSATTWAIPCS